MLRDGNAFCLVCGSIHVKSTFDFCDEGGYDDLHVEVFEVETMGGDSERSFVCLFVEFGDALFERGCLEDHEMFDGGECEKGIREARCEAAEGLVR